MLLFVAIGAVGVPWGIAVIGHYPIYYSWMGFVPLAIGFCGFVSLEAPSLSTYARVLLYSAVGIACLIGLPARLGVTILQWKERDYQPVETLAARTLNPEDWVYADYPAYYAVKPIAALTILPTYRAVISEEEKSHVTALVINPETYDDVVQLFRAKWKDTGDAVRPPLGHRTIGAEKYNLHVWLRIPD